MAKKKKWNEPTEVVTTETTPGGEPEVSTTEVKVPETEAHASTAATLTVPTKTVTSYPDVVQARRITLVGPAAADGSKKLTLADRSDVVVNSSTLSGFQPSVGDYYVMPNEGNPYCAAKSTFAVTYTVSF